MNFYRTLGWASCGYLHPRYYSKSIGDNTPSYSLKILQQMSPNGLLKHMGLPMPCQCPWVARSCCVHENALVVLKTTLRRSSDGKFSWLINAEAKKVQHKRQRQGSEYEDRWTAPGQGWVLGRREMVHACCFWTQSHYIWYVGPFDLSVNPRTPYWQTVGTDGQ